MIKHTIAIFALTILLSYQHGLAKTDTIPITAKQAWGIVTRHLEFKYGSALLYQLQPTSDISANDTSLFIKGKNSLGYDSVFWKGNAYEWYIRCGYEGLSKDSVLYISISAQIAKPHNIKEFAGSVNADYPLNRMIYKAVPDTAWIDSDSWSIKGQLDFSSISQSTPMSISLQYTNRAKNPDTTVVWIRNNFSTIFGLMSWYYYEGETGEYIRGGAVSVEETRPNHTDRVYPNPSASTFSLGKEYSYESVQIANTMGEVVATWLNTEPSTVFSTVGIPSGVYILRTNRSGKQYSQPLIISR